MIIYEQAKEEPLIIGKYENSATYSSYADYNTKFCISKINYNTSTYGRVWWTGTTPGSFRMNHDGKSVITNNFGLSMTGYAHWSCWVCDINCCTHINPGEINFLSGQICRCGLSSDDGGKIGYMISNMNFFDSVFFNKPYDNKFLLEVNLCNNATSNVRYVIKFGDGISNVLTSTDVNFCICNDGLNNFGFIYDGVCSFGKCISTHVGLCRVGGGQIIYYPSQIQVISGNVKFLTELCG